MQRATVMSQPVQRRAAELEESQIIRRPEARELPPEEQRLAALAALFGPAAALSRVMGLSVDDVQRLAALSYFREYRSRGMSLRQIAKRIGKSLRTVATLSKTANDTALDLDDERVEMLREHLLGVTHAVYRRFFQAPHEGEAWAGGLEVRLPADRMRQARRDAWEAMRVVLERAEAEVSDDEARVATASFYFVERPTDLPWRER